MLKIRRRILLGASICSGISEVPLLGKAATLTVADITMLDTPAAAAKSLASVFLVAITTAGDRLVAVGEQGVVIFSDDGGATWMQAQVPVSTTLTCVAFSTPMLGWSAGHFGVILNTLDGGKTWTLQLNGIQVNQLALAAAQDMLEHKTPQLDASPAMALALKRARLFVVDGPDKPFLSMVLLGPQKVLVFGAYRMAVLTTDDGRSWVDWSLHIYDRLSHDLYDAAIVGGNVYLVAETGLVFCSTDAGTTFPQVTSPGNVTLFGVLGARDGSVVTYGVAGSCFRSTDGGKSWTVIGLGTQDDLIAGRLLRSGAIVIARESGGLFISHDDGATFSAVPNIPPMSVSDFESISETGVVIAGGAGASRLALAATNN